MKKSSSFIFIFMLLSFHAAAQHQYAYKREIKDVTEQWHTIALPDEIYGKLKPDLSDIRIFGITKNNDTIEAPYIVKLLADKVESNNVAVNIRNQSKTKEAYFYTLENKSEASVNEIRLSFNRKNFDWKIGLEGSHNQLEWFSIVENYRISSIKNNLVDFQFTTVNFPVSNYRFYRLNIKTADNPELTDATVSFNQLVSGKYKQYQVVSLTADNDKKKKQTIIRANLQYKVPVSNLKIHVKDAVDYYRPVTIKYVTDSVKTEKGWHKNYSTLTRGTLNSIQRNGFTFPNTILDNLVIVIENGDNEPLSIDSVSASGNLYDFIGRFDDNIASYFLYYGNPKARKPNYDIEHFQNKIPAGSSEISLGKEIILKQEPEQKSEPQYKLVLWCLIILIMITIGWFSLKMIKKKE